MGIYVPLASPQPRKSLILEEIVIAVSWCSATAVPSLQEVPQPAGKGARTQRESLVCAAPALPISANFVRGPDSR